MTRLAAAFLALALGAAQTVALTDCCCGELCDRPNEVCDHNEPKPAQDCCAPAPDTQACIHLHPSTQLESHGAALPPCATGISVDLEPPAPPAARPVTLAAHDSLEAARGSPPLYLLNLTLRL